MPKRLFNQALMVVLHFTQRRCTVTSDTVIVPRFEWSDLIEIWHQAFAQLIADGVPRSEILVGGPCQIARLLNAHRRRLRDPSYSSTLPLGNMTIQRRHPRSQPSYSQDSLMSSPLRGMTNRTILISVKKQTVFTTGHPSKTGTRQ